MWVAVSVGVLFLNEHASSSARTLLSASNQIIGQYGIPRRRSIAHCSNCSRVMSAVGGVT